MAVNAHPLRVLIPRLFPRPTISAQRICRRCIANNAINAETPPQYDPALPARERIGPDGQMYRLKKSDFFLKKPLPQRQIPVAHLQHSTSDILHKSEQLQREKTQPHKRLVGVVVSSGKMDKTVRVRISGRTYNKHIGKNYRTYTNHLVHDPNSSLVTGDVIELHRLRVARNVHHVVAAIISPFGTPIEARPPIPTPDERLSAYKAKRFAKLARRKLRAENASSDKVETDAVRSKTTPSNASESDVTTTENVQ